MPNELKYNRATRTWTYSDTARALVEVPNQEEITDFETRYELYIQQESLIKNQLWNTIPAWL